MKPKLFFVFDVESIGLHGDAFAVGFVVIDDSGCQFDSGIFSCDPHAAQGNKSGFDWVAQNVPKLPSTCYSPEAVRNAFWKKWDEWRQKDAVLVAECAWPVEARFLARCVDDRPPEREWMGPHPLYDLSSFLLAMGRNPLEICQRTENEMPMHNPLSDAIHSARKLVEVMKLWVNPSK